MALDVLLAGALEQYVIGFYDDAHAALPEKVRGFPILGDIEMLKSMLSVEPVYVIVAITDNAARLKVANSVRAAGGRFATAIHPSAHLSGAATVGDGSVLTAGAVVHPDASVGSHCSLGPGCAVERDAVVGAGAWLSAGSVIGSGANVGARAFLGYNACVGRKATVRADARVGALTFVDAEGGE